MGVGKQSEAWDQGAEEFWEGLAELLTAGKGAVAAGPGKGQGEPGWARGGPQGQGGARGVSGVVFFSRFLALGALHLEAQPSSRGCIRPLSNGTTHCPSSKGVSRCGCSSGSRHPSKGWVRPKQAGWEFRAGVLGFTACVFCGICRVFL